MKLSFCVLLMTFALICEANAWQCSIKPSDQPEYHPHEIYCYKFYECSNGVPYLFTCPPGQNWDQSVLRCVLADNTCDQLSTLHWVTTTPIPPTTKSARL